MGIGNANPTLYRKAMHRYALKIEYHGAPFCGWQRQDDHPSVQGLIEAALRKLEMDVPSIAAAGRTDTGVHATAQVAHCEMGSEWEPFRLSEALNFHLKPAPVAILEAAVAPEGFHARFSATARHYVFRLQSRRAPLTHDKGLVWQVKHPLDIAAMRNGAAHLIGKHDFTTFRSVQCQALSPVKTLDEIKITACETPYGVEYRFDIKARSFLHNQVRSIVGSLEHVGRGSWQPIQMKTALEAQDRAACGTVCPPHGLYLAGVTYPINPFSGS
ncbi:MAG: tRNA pseudouridine38-40 synthase [Paracoccaceae bacterium]